MIVVVGGGVTGLALGLELEALDADFVVLEADARPGGVIRSRETDGRVLDFGPQRTRMTRNLSRMIARLGLENEVVLAPEGLDLFVFRANRLRRVPFSMVDLVTSDVASLRAKLRLILEPLTPGARPDESVADYFTRKVGRGIYEAFVGPLYGGLYASDPADMRVDSTLGHALRELGVGRSLLMPLLRRGGRVRPPRACSFQTGMAALPGAMARALGGQLQLGTPVRGLRRSGAGWNVEFEGGAMDAEAVVLCVPAPAAARLLERVAPESASATEQLLYNPLAVVHLDATTELNGLGFQVAFTEPERTLRGVTFNDSLFDRRNLYTAYLGGARHPEVATMSDERLAALAVEEFRICTGYDNARALCVSHQRMPAWDMTWTAMQHFALAPGLHVAGNWRSRPGLAGRLAEARRVAFDLVGFAKCDVAP